MRDTAPKVIKIPAKPEAAKTAATRRQLRVAAYCRVSTKEEDQANSYEVQREYYTDKIMANPEWTMGGIFADKGITGTSAKKREDFMRMIKHCRQHKIDMILTKSVSRFARNTVDCLYYTRTLKALGIAVVFEKENINSLEEDSELRITLSGAFAQSESESISANVTWGKRRAMEAGIVNLDKSIANVTREQPKLRAFISTLEQERQKKQEEIRALEAEIDGIYQQEDERARLRDINARKGKVVGRISLWVESVQNDTESEQQEQVIREIEKRVQEIDSILDTDSVDERKQSALSRIQEDMTKWAKELQLEHCDNPYRLDLNKVTVIVDKPERPVPLKQLGSGSNWVGVHLIAYFALQHYFIGAKRPVPRFMFLDQPSQVYFPSEFDEKKTDWNEVNKIYQFVIDRTTELQGQLQVIIVDHADLKKDSFREFIRENWWPDDKNLVPIDWYKSE